MVLSLIISEPLMVEKYYILMTVKKAGIVPATELYLDELYVLPNYDWIKNEFSKSFKSLKYYLNILTWRPEINDCDNFSNGARFLANVLNSNSTNKKANIAVGEYYYVTDQGGGHAINFFIHSPSHNINDLVLDFYEPQNDTIIKLSQNEKQSCLGLII